MKILHTEWSDGWGGQEIRILLDAQVLTEMGHQVTLLVCPDSGLAKNVRRAGLPHVEMRIKHAYDPVAFWKLFRMFKKEQFQVVNTHSSVDSWVASAAAKAAGVPVLVRTRHLSVPISTNPLNLAYKWPDAIVTTAEMIRQRMIDVNKMDPERVLSIATGVDLKRFDPHLDPGNIREALGLAKTGRVAVMVAVLRTWKRHEIFLEAAAQLAGERPDLQFLVVGDGPGRKRVADKIESLGLTGKAIMTGHRTDVEKILAIADVCVLTSESSEGVPQSVLQYQAMARPVVGTTAGGIPEIVQDGETGLLCPINDASAVAEAMARILDNPDLAEKLGQNARKQVEAKHSVAVMANTTLDLYRRIHAAKTGKPLE